MMSRRRMKDKKTKASVKAKKDHVEVAEKMTPSKEEMFAQKEKVEQTKKEGFKLPSKKTV